MRNLLFLAALIAIPACAQLDTEGAGASQEEATAPVTAASSKEGSAWNNVAPGVWERRTSDGRGQRIGHGLDGLRFSLAQARQEHAQLLSAGPRALTQQQKSAELISTLEQRQAELEREGGREARAEPGDLLEAMDGPLYYSVCGASFTLDVYRQILGLLDVEVHAVATYHDHGAPNSFTKQLDTYTYARVDETLVEDEDSSGSFTNTPSYIETRSSSFASTFVPQLYGRAFVTVTNGCSGFKIREEYP